MMPSLIIYSAHVIKKSMVLFKQMNLLISFLRSLEVTKFGTSLSEQNFKELANCYCTFKRQV